MNYISLDAADIIINTALEHSKTLKTKPLTVSVLDAGGHLIAFKRQDKSGILRPNISQGKAWGALGMGLGGRSLAKRAEMAPAFFMALASTSEGRVIPVPGGVLVKNANGDILGAVGISGDSPDNDEACAVKGIEQANLVADPG